MTTNWSNIQRVHLIGIGGVGISALGLLLLSLGKEVSGTEDNESVETLRILRERGALISQSLHPKELPDADCYIYSDAWLTKHTDVLEEAKKRNKPTFSYFEALGILTAHYKVIAVAGAHGKTTTTAMVTDVCEAAGLDPSAIIGSLRAKTGSNFKAGSGEYFIVEADEYRRHFLHFTPYLLIITNMDADHLDYYRDMEDIQSAFRELAQKVPASGAVICDTHEAYIQPVIEGLSCGVIDYTPYIDPELPMRVLPLHRKNAGAVLAAAVFLGIDANVARNALSAFSGTWRRFEHKGTTAHGAEVYDDYAHHPEEIRATLASVRTQFPDKHIWVVFQPHLYSRTKAFLEDFAQAFKDADKVYIVPIFAAREAADPSISHRLLAERLEAHGADVQAFDSLKEAATYLADHATSQEIIITMGAGDIYMVAETLTAPSI